MRPADQQKAPQGAFLISGRRERRSLRRRSSPTHKSNEPSFLVFHNGTLCEALP